MERRSGGSWLGKMELGLLLISLYAVIVISAAPDWVAWEAPLVIGSLDVQTTASGFPPRNEEPAGDRLFTLLGILSAGAVLLLASKRLGIGEVPPPKGGAVRHPSPSDWSKVQSPVRREEPVSLCDSGAGPLPPDAHRREVAFTLHPDRAQGYGTEEESGLERHP